MSETADPWTPIHHEELPDDWEPVRHEPDQKQVAHPKPKPENEAPAAGLTFTVPPHVIAVLGTLSDALDRNTKALVEHTKAMREMRLLNDAAGSDNGNAAGAG